MSLRGFANWAQAGRFNGNFVKRPLVAVMLVDEGFWIEENFLTAFHLKQ
jgi:hypothetical protein